MSIYPFIGDTSGSMDEIPLAVTNGRFWDHRGQTSKSLFLFFIAGISFTS